MAHVSASATSKGQARLRRLISRANSYLVPSPSSSVEIPYDATSFTQVMSAFVAYFFNESSETEAVARLSTTTVLDSRCSVTYVLKN